MTVLGIAGGQTARALFLATAVLTLPACGPVDEPPAAASERPQTPGEQIAGDGRPVANVPTPPQRGAWVILGSDTVVAEVARTQEETKRGLMYRSEMPDGTGVLLLFQGEEIRSWWMPNVYVGLDVAFMDVNLRIVDIQQIEAETTQARSSRAPAMFALMVPQGWLAAHGVAAGATAELVLGPL